MQPLIQHMSSQIIDSYLHFPQRFSDFSCYSCTCKQNNFVNIVFKKWQNFLFCFQVQLLQFLSLNNCGFDPELKWSRQKLMGPFSTCLIQPKSSDFAIENDSHDWFRFFFNFLILFFEMDTMKTHISCSALPAFYFCQQKIPYFRK